MVRWLEEEVEKRRRRGRRRKRRRKGGGRLHSLGDTCRLGRQL
jgi:hypothetical protein